MTTTPSPEGLQEPALAKLAREYRPTMDRDVLHSWAQDVVKALSTPPVPQDQGRRDALERIREALGFTEAGIEHDASLNLQGALDDLTGRYRPDDGGVCANTVSRAIAQLENVRAILATLPQQAATDEGEAEADNKLVAHFVRMMEAAANYVEPTTYMARHPDTSRIGDCKWVREFPEPNQHQSDSGKAETKHRRDQAFISDMIYMLDGPEQRAALATPQPTAGEPVRELLDSLCSWLLHRFGPDSPEGREASLRQKALYATPQPTEGHWHGPEADALLSKLRSTQPTETQRIVAWLRELQDDEWYPRHVADAIERGEHLAGEGQ